MSNKAVTPSQKEKEIAEKQLVDIVNHAVDCKIKFDEIFIDYIRQCLIIAACEGFQAGRRFK